MTESHHLVSIRMVLLGAVVALAVTVSFNLLGGSIGLVTIGSGGGATTLGVGIVFWLILSTLLSNFVGGMSAVAGCGCQSQSRASILLQGAGVWAVLTLVMVYLSFSSAGGVISTAGQLLEKTVAGGAQISAPLVEKAYQKLNQTTDLEAVLDENLQDLSLSKQDMENVGTEVTQMLIQSGGKPGYQVKEKLVNRLAEETGQPKEKVYEAVSNVFAKADQLKQQGQQALKEAKEATAKNTAYAVLVLFLMNILGLIAAVGGAWWQSRCRSNRPVAFAKGL